jgi:hypothetical protein
MKVRVYPARGQDGMTYMEWNDVDEVHFTDNPDARPTITENGSRKRKVFINPDLINAMIVD